MSSRAMLAYPGRARRSDDGRHRSSDSSSRAPSSSSYSSSASASSSSSRSSQHLSPSHTYSPSASLSVSSSSSSSATLGRGSKEERTRDEERQPASHSRYSYDDHSLSAVTSRPASTGLDVSDSGRLEREPLLVRDPSRGSHTSRAPPLPERPIHVRGGSTEGSPVPEERTILVWRRDQDRSQVCDMADLIVQETAPLAPPTVRPDIVRAWALQPSQIQDIQAQWISYYANQHRHRLPSVPSTSTHPDIRGSSSVRTTHDSRHWRDREEEDRRSGGAQEPDADEELIYSMVLVSWEDLIRGFQARLPDLAADIPERLARALLNKRSKWERHFDPKQCELYAAQFRRVCASSSSSSSFP